MARTAALLLSAVASLIVSAEGSACWSAAAAWANGTVAGGGAAAVASGRGLPYDAGDYAACVAGVAGARYFLVGAGVAGGPAVPAAELGLCAPEACVDADVAALVGDLPAVLAAAASGAAFVRNHSAEVPAVLAVCFELPTQVEAEECAAALLLAARLVDDAAPGLKRLANASHGVNFTVTSPQLDLRSLGGDPWALVAVHALALLLAVAAVGTAADVFEMGDADEADGLQEPLLPTSEPPAEEAGDGDAPPACRCAASSGVLWRVARRAALACVPFSVATNVRKLVRCPDRGPTDSLNGMRVLSMFWIILGHTFMMPGAIAGYDNPHDIVGPAGAEQSPLFQVLLGGELAVDTFFFISAFLFMHLSLPSLERKGVHVAPMVVGRYLRLTPVLALVELVYYKITPYLADGPFAQRFQHSVFRRCDPWWWSELLYLVNFVPFNSDDVCMGWTWYLGNDFIFFVVAPLVLLMWKRREALAWAFMAASCAVSFAVTGWLVAKHDINAYIFDSHYARYTYYAYSKPYCRWPAFCIGLAAGALMHRARQPGCRAPPAHVLRAGAVLASGVLVAVLLWCTSLYRSGGEGWTVAHNVVYIVFARPIWALALSVLTYAFMEGAGSVVCDALALPVFVPLARLTYAAYLLHPVVIKLLAGNATQYLHFTFAGVASSAIANIVYAYTAAAAAWLLAERPAQTLLSSLARR